MFEQAFKNIDDALRKEAGCASELDYAEQTSWLLFLKYLDSLEHDKSMEAELEGKEYTFLLDEAYRWESWAAPKDADGKLDHNKELVGDDLREFVDRKLDQAKLTPLLKLKYHDSIADAVADLGKPDEIGKVFAGFQKYLY
jgi:type I restriction enzyme M protein